MKIGDHDRSVPLVIVGLGNPGPEYDGTRHNVGFAVVDQIKQSLRRPVAGSSTGSEWTTGHWKWRKTHLLKPLRFMNLSGDPVRLFLQTHQLKPSQILVVLDDIDLPLGALRLRNRGSAGGHRGLDDIISALGSSAIARCRVGVGRPTEQNQVQDHVLERPTGPEAGIFEQTIKRATDSALCWLLEGVTNAARRYNGPLPEEGHESSNGYPQE
ncbi:MAG: aminoacyl-tRNA hydrolase [Planctomycetota bacterium]